MIDSFVTEKFESEYKEIEEADHLFFG